MRRLTPEQSARAVQICKKISDALGDDTDDEMLATALTFYLLGVIKVNYGPMSEREAVDFCVKRIQTYGQVAFS